MLAYASIGAVMFAVLLLFLCIAGVILLSKHPQITIVTIVTIVTTIVTIVTIFTIVTIVTMVTIVTIVTIVIVYKHCNLFVMLRTEERFPSQVNASSITFPVIEEDTRPGFLGQAVLHISWARPKGQCTHLLNHDDVMYCIVLRNRNKHCHILCRFGAHNSFYSVFFLCYRL